MNISKMLAPPSGNNKKIIQYGCVFFLFVLVLLLNVRIFYTTAQLLYTPHLLCNIADGVIFIITQGAFLVVYHFLKEYIEFIIKG